MQWAKVKNPQKYAEKLKIPSGKQKIAASMGFGRKIVKSDEKLIFVLEKLDCQLESTKSRSCDVENVIRENISQKNEKNSVFGCFPVVNVFVCI